MVMIWGSLNLLLKDLARTPFSSRHFPLCVLSVVEEKEKEMQQVFLLCAFLKFSFHQALCLDINVDINDVSNYVFKLLAR